MASSFTTNKSIEKPAYNDYASSPTGWSVPVNNDWDIIDKAFGGILSLNATGSVGTVNLSTSQAQNLILTISGAMTGNAVYTLPLNSGSTGIVGGQWIVRNATTGSFTVTVAPISGGGSSVSIPQGETVSIFSDGTNVALADNPTSTVNAILATRDVFAGPGLTGGGSLSGDVTLSADQATAANWRENVSNKLLNPNAVWNAMSEVTLTEPTPPSTTFSWDMSAGFDFILTLNGNRTLANPTNTKVGQKGRLIIQQDATGSRTLTWGSNFKFANATPPTLSTTANATDVLYYDIRSSSYIIITLAGRSFA